MENGITLKSYPLIISFDIFLLFKDIKTLEKESYSFLFLFKLSN